MQGYNFLHHHSEQFQGKFFACYDDATGDKLQCEDFDFKITKDWCNNATGMRWTNAKVHFDNVLMGYLALFQVVRYSII